MGLEANIINAALTVISNQQAQITSLQANSKDTADLAAEQTAEANPAIAAILNPTPTVTGGAGTDTTAGGDAPDPTQTNSAAATGATAVTNPTPAS